MRDITEIDRTIGFNIRLVRKARGFTLMRLAAAIGVSYQQLRKYEKAIDRIPASRLWAVACAFGVPIGAFFTVQEGLPRGS